MKITSYQNREIPSFLFYQSGLSSLTSILISHRNNAKNTDKIFISNVKYLKLLKYYSSAINIEISIKVPLV